VDIFDEIKSNNNFIIFKYSPYCPISQFQEFAFDEWIKHQAVKYTKINVITQRDISNAIANIFNIKHESPQIIFFIDGTPVYHASHNNINLNKIESML